MLVTAVLVAGFLRQKQPATKTASAQPEVLLDVNPNI
jgi:hypothetical protein